MTIGLVYAMPGEIETLLTDETRTPIRTEAGVSFYQIRPHIIACCCGVSKVNAAMGAQLLISLGAFQSTGSHRERRKVYECCPAAYQL